MKRAKKKLPLVMAALRSCVVVTVEGSMTMGGGATSPFFVAPKIFLALLELIRPLMLVPVDDGGEPQTGAETQREELQEEQS